MSKSCDLVKIVRKQMSKILEKIKDYQIKNEIVKISKSKFEMMKSKLRVKKIKIREKNYIYIYI